MWIGVTGFTPRLEDQDLEYAATLAGVFLKKLQIWDGCGFNYVENAPTYDYQNSSWTMAASVCWTNRAKGPLWT